jgi:hypothetical protein
MPTISVLPNQFTAADDPHKMLLRCILSDAIEWDYGITDACAACRAAEDICPAHWDEHQNRRERYHMVMHRLEQSEGLNTACVLAAGHQQTIKTAVQEAICYRQRGKTAEDYALLAAYRTMQPTRRARAQALSR